MVVDDKQRIGGGNMDCGAEAGVPNARKGVAVDACTEWRVRQVRAREVRAGDQGDVVPGLAEQLCVLGGDQFAAEDQETCRVWRGRQDVAQPGGVAESAGWPGVWS